MMWRSALLWILAFLFTAGSAVYQRMTGPTYPIRGEAEIHGTTVAYRLPRSAVTGRPREVVIRTPDSDLHGTLQYRRYRSTDAWTAQPLAREDGQLVGRIPSQPPAGKVMYRIRLQRDDALPAELTDHPVILRYRGDVPAAVLIAHIVIIFGGMLCSTRAGFEALRGKPRTRNLTIATLVGLVLGGFVLGPVVQKYAFGAFWTGWPFGTDLTDNKIAVAVAFWLVATWRTWKHPDHRGWVITAAIVTLGVWLIPHSLLGSELDYTQLAPTTREVALAH